jgi:hypothetical protein
MLYLLLHTMAIKQNAVDFIGTNNQTASSNSTNCFLVFQPFLNIFDSFKRCLSGREDEKRNALTFDHQEENITKKRSAGTTVTSSSQVPTDLSTSSTGLQIYVDTSSSHQNIQHADPLGQADQAVSELPRVVSNTSLNLNAITVDPSPLGLQEETATLATATATSHEARGLCTAFRRDAAAAAATTATTTATATTNEVGSIPPPSTPPNAPAGAVNNSPEKPSACVGNDPKSGRPDSNETVGKVDSCPLIAVKTNHLLYVHEYRYP